MICIVTYVIGCLFQLYIYIYMLFYCRQSNLHGLLAAVVCVIIGLRTHFWLRTCLSRITHILFSWTVSIVLPNHTQFILVNHMLYIVHTFIWLPVSFVPPHRKQFIELNRMPCIAHATKIWTVFDASVIANILHLFWWFLQHRLRLWHRTQFHRRASDRSVVFGPSCSSALSILALARKNMASVISGRVPW